MHELLPIALGLIVGLVIGASTSRRRLVAWLCLSAALGASVTFITGEWKVSWAYFLLDVPAAVGAAVAGHLIARRVATRIRTSGVAN